MSDSVDNEKGITAVVATTPEDAFCVTFQNPFDPDNPKDWPARKKWAVTIILSAAGLNRIMVSTIMAPALTTIGNELQMNSVETVMAMSVYLLATAFGPLFLGPLSEMYGRKPVLHATNIWFLIWNIVCGFARNKSTLIVSRLLAGFGSSAIYALGGGVLGDLWRPEQRGRSLGVYMLLPLLGVSIGPIVGGTISEYTTWRWMFWSTSILQGFMVILSFSLFHETHAPTILWKRAEQLRLTTGSKTYHIATEKLQPGQSTSRLLLKDLSRPVRLLLFHPIIQVQACLSAFNYGITYLVLSTFSDLWNTQYHESIFASSLHYIALCLGEIIGATVGGPLMDFSYKRMKRRASGILEPEIRIPLMIPGAMLIPCGLLIYGWAAQRHVYWLVVDIGGAVLGVGMMTGGQALQAYVIDSYPDHTGSATAASQFLRSLTAFGFPLFAPAMYKAMGYGWGNSMLAFASILIGIPAPILVWKYGSRLRAMAQSSL